MGGLRVAVELLKRIYLRDNEGLSFLGRQFEQRFDRFLRQNQSSKQNCRRGPSQGTFADTGRREGTGSTERRNTMPARLAKWSLNIHGSAVQRAFVRYVGQSIA